MQNPIQLLVDVDGVLADFVGKLFTVYNSLHGGNLTSDDLTNFDFHSSFTKDVADRMYPLFNAPGFFLDLPVHEEARVVVAELLAMGVVIEVCTAPPSVGSLDGKVLSPYAASEKMVWIQRNFPELGKNITLTRNKYLVRGDILVDDGLHNIFSWCEAHPRGIGYVIDRPWNRGRPIPDNAVRGSMEALTYYIKGRNEAERVC